MINVVAAALTALAILPVWLAQRFGGAIRRTPACKGHSRSPSARSNRSVATSRPSSW